MYAKYNTFFTPTLLEFKVSADATLRQVADLPVALLVAKDFLLNLTQLTWG